jgi:hypothetical protein
MRAQKGRDADKASCPEKIDGLIAFYRVLSPVIAFLK